MFFKKAKFILTAAAALTIVAGLVAFKIADKTQSAVTQQWYTITITDTSDPNNPQNQEVSGGSITAPPSSGADCALTNPGMPCAGFFEVPDPSYSFSTPETLDDLPPGVTFLNQYAKSDE